MQMLTNQRDANKMHHRPKSHMAATIMLLCVGLSVGRVAGRDYDRVHSLVTQGPGSRSRSESNQIPLSFIRKLNKMNSTADLYQCLVANNTITHMDLMTASRSLDMANERSASKQPIPASCIPSPEVVSLAPENADPTDVYFPTCTRVNRCSGCCSSSLLQCQAIETKEIIFEVERLVYNFETGELQHKEKVPVVVEEHVDCDCLCRVKESHCNKQQEYNEDGCECVCKNQNERSKCNESIMIWDSNSCKCRCRDPNRTCSSGSYFDEKQCKCVRDQSTKRRLSAEERRKLILKASPSGAD